MAEKEEKGKPFSTCLEDVPFAEFIQMMSGGRGLGLCCAELMRKRREMPGVRGGCDCAEMMRSMMNKSAGKEKGPVAVGKGEDHGGDR